MWWTDGNGYFHQGDCQPNERQATDAEVAAWRATLAQAQLTSMAVTAFQAQAAMSLSMSQGITSFDLLGKVQALVAASSNPLVALAWNKAEAFDRQSPMILSLAAQVPLTSTQIDQLFQLASTITA